MLRIALVAVLLSGCASFSAWRQERRERREHVLQERQAAADREASYDQICAAPPPNLETERWCEMREREKDRQLVREEMNAERRAERRRAIGEAFRAAAPVPPTPSTSIHCSSSTAGNTVYTDCN